MINDLEAVKEKLPILEEQARAQEKSRQIQQTLFEIAQSANDAKDLPSFLKQMHEYLKSLLVINNFYVVLLDSDTEMVKFVYYVDEKDDIDVVSRPPQPVKIFENTLTGLVIKNAETQFFNSQDLEKLLEKKNITVEGNMAHQWLGIPLISDQKLLGTMVTQSYDLNYMITDEDKELLEYVSQPIAATIAKRQAQDKLIEANLFLEDRVKQRTAELEKTNENLLVQIDERKRAEKLQAILYQISEQSASELPSKEFYRNIHQLINQLVPSPNFFIAVLDEHRQNLIFDYRHEDEVNPVMKLAIDFNKELNHCTPTEAVLLTGKPLLINDMNRVNYQPVGRKAETWLGVPLIADGVTQGVMVIQSYDQGVYYDERSQELLTFVAQNISAALLRRINRSRLSELYNQLKEAHDKLEERVKSRTVELEKLLQEREEIQNKLAFDAMHDALTGAPNRSLLSERLDNAIANLKRKPNHHFSVMYLDLDRFKGVNDSLGHNVGDELLKETTKRLKSCVRDSDIVARMGGDEFCILAFNIDDKRDLHQLCFRILSAIEQPYHIAGREIYTSTSIGYTVSQLGYDNTTDMLRDADSAMYEAKANGKNRFVAFNKAMQEATLRTTKLETELRHAVQNNEIKLLYQPIYDLNNLEIVSIEALARWVHPDYGTVGPAEFIPIAEDLGLIHDFGIHILDTAISEISILENAGIKLNINLSSRQFDKKTLKEDLMSVCNKYHFPTARINLEVTESLLIADINTALQTLKELQQAGFTILLDDFGTGYSSLSYLHRLPLNGIKTDKSFMLENDTFGKKLLKSIVTAANELELSITAEGIESEDQFETAKSLKFDTVQGFLFSRPTDIGEIRQELDCK